MALSKMNESVFRRQIDSALKKVKQILDTNRHPTHPNAVDHTYDDKFGLVENLTNIAIAGQGNVLGKMGLQESQLRSLISAVKNEKKSVCLRFEIEHRCEFVSEREYEIEGPTQFVKEVEKFSMEDEKVTTSRHKVLHKVKEYKWKVTVDSRLFAYAGSDISNNTVTLQKNTSHFHFTREGIKEPPSQSNKNSQYVEMPLTWLLQNISSETFTSCFSIDRTTKSCRTPRRNEDIEGALKYFQAAKIFGSGISSQFRMIRDTYLSMDCSGWSEGSIEDSSNELFAYLPMNWSGWIEDSSSELFIPSLPFFEERTAEDQETEEMKSDQALIESGLGLCHISLPDHSAKSPHLSNEDVNLFLQEQCKSIDRIIAKVSTQFESSGKNDPMSAIEASLIVLCHHMVALSHSFTDGVNFVETMLRSQLIAAIGKEVGPKEFGEFVAFHSQKMLKDEFVPVPFCHAIRQPEHYPDGVVSIESRSSRNTNQGMPDPILTLTRKFSGESVGTMSFSINAATKVEFSGDQYLHAWMPHQFGGSMHESYNLVGRARQFSGFILLVGKISGLGTFDAQHGIIVQNKDEVLIPLILEPLPTAKEFRDAIISLSPEQQQFAKMFRNMQLESSVFGVCVIQLKPALEVLLGLPNNALTKEIGLTQDLLRLFIEYQIPSDLLSFDGSADMSVREKLGEVKKHVSAVDEVIANSKKRELDNAKMASEMTEQNSRALGLFQTTPPIEVGLNDCSNYEEHSITCYEEDSSYGSYNNNGEDDNDQSDDQCFFEEAETFFVAAAFRNASLVHGSKSAPLIFNSQNSKRTNAMPTSHSPSTPTTSRQQVANNMNRFDGNNNNNGEMNPFDDNDNSNGGDDSNTADFTKIPKQLERDIERFDGTNADKKNSSVLRSTKIWPDVTWTKKHYPNLLDAQPTTKSLHSEEQKSEQNRAFDLLDALSRSGSLPIACAELHVMVCVTHDFDRSVMDTVIHDNVNPISRLERSSLIVGSTIHGISPSDMLKNESDVERVKNHSPMLLLTNGDGGEE